MAPDKPTLVYKEGDGNIAVLNGKTIAMIGYGNQGRSQALNMRDSGLHVIVGNRDDTYKARAEKDGFEVHPIGEAVQLADVSFLLVPDEVMGDVFERDVRQNLKDNAAIVFASGYNVAFGLIELPANADVLLIAPRMIGVGVRECFLNKKGFFSFVHVHTDRSGNANAVLLALAKGVGSLVKGAIDVTFKQEAVLDLFNEQAFGPAFGRVLLSAISTLVDAGYPPEAVLVEMYMSGEMSYTYQKMGDVGLVKQTNFHSQTSQYGAMSRGIKFLSLPVKEKMKEILEHIENGGFAREWEQPISRLKFKLIKFFAMRQKINKLERDVRRRLGVIEKDILEAEPPTDEEMQALNEIKKELRAFENSFSEF
ncbi:MAG: NAD(P)-binding domain-containing protein [Candidatus Lokiarchaeota archaeon]|nr:NAD(P)-binding domain-containing protein [Candidatus Lokiarchaeota archaeon]